MIEHKVLPFVGKFGPVPGHAVLAHQGWEGAHHPRTVVFRTFSAEAQCPIETHVDVSHLTAYLQRMWPAYGEIHAVILTNGQRVHTTCLTCVHGDDAAWDRAPALTRTPFKIVALSSRIVLFEVVGVQAWAHSQRRPEDAALILDPWARDNAAYAARMAAQQA